MVLLELARDTDLSLRGRMSVLHRGIRSWGVRLEDNSAFYLTDVTQLWEFLWFRAVIFNSGCNLEAPEVLLR